ncbi:TNT domain-containing protein [Saccharothrix syringae]|uniref:DUF4237 domain-containing protein n=1 Tax=Saccharothrix syringae TaxID=103733 RepID=A0A5Q0HC34_SACSY|nr:TNT domain-containing protein [Saccharothrix syringae]QFZ23370.1 DUF4237 domain-containing protein [Saccharothrix syringae]
MSELKPLNPTEQDALVKQIGLTLMRAAPEEWRHVTAEYRATGRYSELSAEVRSADGALRAWSPPQEVAALFARLRAGMYREGRGSWSNARYQLDHPSSYNLDFDRNEPSWQTPPPPQAYLDEMRFFPRTDENVPDWLRRKLQQAPPPPRAFRTARVFDGAGPGGRPSVNRPPVAEADRDLLLSYLDRAPVAVVGRGFDADVLNPDAPQVVPVAFQTDGLWIWPAAVGYYLRAYGVPPEPELVERAKAQDFVLPEVTEEARVAAAANLGAPAAPQGTALPVAEPVEASAEPPAEVGATVAAPLPELVGDDEPGGRADVERTADLGDVKPEAVEYEQDGPPYRVRFEEDGPVIDDRYRRETYVEGMDLFTPAQYEQRELNDTQAWNPFSDEEPEPARGGEAPEEPAAQAREEAPAEPVVEQPTPDEVTAEFEVDQEQLYQAREDEPFDAPPVGGDDEGAGEREDARFDEHDRHEHDRHEHDRHDFEEAAEQPFAERSFDEQPFAEQPFAERQFAEQPFAEEAAQGAGSHAEQEPAPFVDTPTQYAEPPTQFTDAPAQFTDQRPEPADQAPQPDRFADAPPADRFADAPPADRFTDAPPAGQFAEQVPPPFADQAPDRFAEAAQPFRDATPTPPPPPQVVEPRQVTPEEERELANVRRALDEFDVPPAAYRFGGEPADRTWLLRTEGQDWEVSWFDHGPTNPVRFDRVEDAAAYLVGKLVLAHRRPPRPNPLPPPPPPPQQRPRPPVNNGFREEPQPPRRPAPPDRRPPVEPPAGPVPPADRQDRQPEPKSSRTWPINPMSGEPPLTLFRHKKMTELPPGMEVDRFGDGSGNLVYAAGTPFPQRSLVPSWVNRPYRVYRLRRPVEVLTGVAVPWFEQPGGGTAYLMPKSIDDMIADGALVEVANQEAPTH